LALNLKIKGNKSIHQPVPNSAKLHRKLANSAACLKLPWRSAVPDYYAHDLGDHLFGKPGNFRDFNSSVKSLAGGGNPTRENCHF